MQKFKKFKVLIFCFVMLFALLVIIGSNKTKASENTIYVDDDYTYPTESNGSISKPFKYLQSAINAAQNGDIIKVLPGDYGEDLIINKSVRITTENRSVTFIVSNLGNSYLIDIVASSVSLEGFTIFDNSSSALRKAVIHIASDANDVRVIGNFINNSYNGYGVLIDGSSTSQNAVINNNTINSTRGIKIQSASSISIFRNDVSNCTYGRPALDLVASSSNYIENNTFRNGTYGIYAQSNSGYLTIKNNTVCGNVLQGIVLAGASNNYLENNTIFNNGNTGISLGSSYSSIKNNTIYKNNVGLSIDTTGCNVTNNKISDCTTYGIQAKPGSAYNYIFDNTFFDKTSLYHAIEQGNNYWDDVRSTGNYWDDYYGPDNDNNSRGDIPYTTGGVNDRYPKGIFQKPPIISDPSPTHLATGVDRQPTLSVKVVDPEGKRVNVKFYVIINNESRVINDNPVSTESGGRASVPFFSIVQGKNAVYTYAGTGYDYICVWYAVAEDQYSKTYSNVAVGTEWIFTTLHTPLDNNEPVADAGGPYKNIRLGDEVHFDGSGCNDSDGKIEFYRWSFGDGTSAINVQSPVHRYASEGNYTVSLIVIDNKGASSNDSITVQVGGNNPPTADVGGPYTGYKTGNKITFDGSKSSDDGTIESYEWTFGDGSNGYGKTITHSYDKTGDYDVKLTVTDDEGLNDTSSITLTIEQSSSSGGSTPGFELIILFCAIALTLLLRRKRQ